MENISLAQEQFNLLKQNRENFSIQDILSLIGKIRNNVVNDDELASLCQHNTDLAEQRRVFLGDLKDYQLSIIHPIISDKTVSSYAQDSSARINDFDKAKSELLKICETEMSTSWQGCQSQMLSTISDTSVHTQSLNYVSDHCINSHFRVLLMAEFQSGKTTLMNALCGRIIGPMGKGIATSAVPIEVSYGEKDKVQFFWKSKESLEHLIEHVCGLIDDYFDISHFSLDNEKSRISLLKKIDAFRSQQDFSACGEKEVKYFAICSFILRFYDSSELSAFKNSNVNVSEVIKYISFPNSKNGSYSGSEFETRWKENGFLDFSFAESVFCFIDHVEVFCCSEKLKNINCTIVDCPGLSASAYDTSITAAEMTKADAILYLTQYDKAIGEKDNDILFRIRDGYHDCWRKLIVLNNYSPDKDFIQANRNKIKNMFGDQTLFIPIDVYVASLGSFKDSNDKGELSDSEIELFLESHKKKPNRFIKEVKAFSSLDDCWKSELERLFGRNIEFDNANVLQELQDVYDQLSMFVKSNSSYSIILSNGAYRLLTELSTIEARLKPYVETFIDGREKASIKWENRIASAHEFDASISELAHHHFFDVREDGVSLVQRLSNVVYDDVFSRDTYKSIYHGICDIIYENKLKIAKLAISEDKLKEFLRPKIQDCITGVIKDKVSGWNQLMISNEAKSFANIFTPEMKDFGNSLTKSWNEKFSDDESMKENLFVYLDMPTTTKGLTMTAFSSNASATADMKLILQTIMLNLGVFITGIAMLVSSYVCFIILSVYAGTGIALTNPVTAAIGMIALLAGGIAIFAGEDKIRQAFYEKMSAKIEEEFKKNDVYSKFKESISSVVSTMMDTFSKKLSLNFKRIEDDRDRSLNSSSEEIEQNCYVAVEIIDAIHCQGKAYIEFIENNKMK